MCSNVDAILRHLPMKNLSSAKITPAAFVEGRVMVGHIPSSQNLQKSIFMDEQTEALGSEGTWRRLHC